MKPVLSKTEDLENDQKLVSLLETQDQSERPFLRNRERMTHITKIKKSESVNNDFIAVKVIFVYILT